MQRKILVVALSALLFVPFFTTHAEEGSIESAKFFSTIGVLEGRNGDLALDKPVMRAEIMKILAKVATEGLTPTLSYPCFEDTEEGQWYSAYACWGERQGIISGIQKSGIDDSNIFAPGKYVTYAEAMKMVATTFHFEDAQISIMENLSGDWYDVYVKVLISLNLVNADVYNKLALPMPRGEVIDLIYKAMILKESGKATFADTDRAQFPLTFGKRKNEDMTIVLTEGQQKIMDMLVSQIKYGFKPQTEKGNATLHLDVKDQEGKGTDSLLADVVVTSSEKVKGTENTLDAYDADVTVNAKVDAFLSAEKLKGTFNVKTHVILSGTGMLFVKLDDFSSSNLEASESVKSQVAMAEAFVKPYIGNWYSFDLGKIVGSDVSTLTDDGTMKEMAITMINNGLPYYLSKVNVQLSQEGNQDVLMVKLTPEAIKRAMLRAMKEDVNNYNKYSFAKELVKADMIIDTLVSHLTITLKASSQTHLLNTADILFTEWNYIPSAETTDPIVKLSFRGSSALMYPETVQIVYPEGARDFMEVMSSMMPSFN